jgi:competence protein ComFC
MSKKKEEKYRDARLIAAFYEGEYQGNAWGPKWENLAHVKGADLDDVLAKLRSAVTKSRPTYELKGNWVMGFAYDLHTTGSKYIGQDANGHARYDNTYSDMGKLVNQLKYQPNYQNDESVVNKIVDLLQNFIKLKFTEPIEAIVPIPPSNTHRAIQPVSSIATELGKRFGIKVYLDILTKSSGSKELKSISDEEERQKVLKETMHIATPYDFSGKNVLLMDDLYCSGSTLKVATELLYNTTKAKNVYVLTMAKTRIKR